MYRFKHAFYATTAICLVTAGLSYAQNDASITPANYAASTEWPTYGHDQGGMRFSPLKQITTANVANLKQAWVYHLKPDGYVAPAGRGGGGGRGAPPADDSVAPPAGGRGAAPAAAAPPGGGRGAAPAGAPAGAAAAGGGRGGAGGAPAAFAASENASIIINGVMYMSSPYGRVVALDAMTGKEVWIYNLPNGASPSTRGVEYFPGDATTPAQILFGTSGSQLISLDAKTGAINTKFGDNGIVTLDKSPTSPPVMFKNIIVIGGRVGEGSGPGTPGDVNAYDIHDGKKAWTFHTIPQPGEPNFDTRGWNPKSTVQRSGVNVWGTMSVDNQRGIVYVPTGAPSGDLFGGDRPGNNLYDTSLVAIDALTGKYKWHFQVVHHDIWDYDLSDAPVLFDLKQGGRTIPALSIVGKSSLMYILDRTNGKPIYGVEERKVPQSDVPGEKTSATQPFPIKPPPIAKNSMSAKDMSTWTPELQAACQKLVDDNKMLIERPAFSPNAYNHSGVVFPSEIGGANWGGASYSPDLGYVFVNANELGQIIGTSDPASGPVNLDTLVGNVAGGRQGPYSGFGPGGRFSVRTAAGQMPCQNPPWGSLVAVNVNTGDIAWKVPLGITESLPADKQKTGRPNMGGSIATAGGLVFIGAADDSRFRAFDAKTGKELWTQKMNASGSSTPSTYQGKDGKQYVVLTTTGGSNSGAAVTSDEVTAFVLP